MLRRGEVISVTDLEHAAGLDQEPVFSVLVLADVGVALGPRDVHDLANLSHRQIEGRLPQLFDQLPCPRRSVGVGCQGVMYCQSHRRCPFL